MKNKLNPRQKTELLVSQIKAALERNESLIEYQKNRIDALNKRQMKYQGAPCLNGHSGIRYSKTTVCCECLATVYRCPDYLAGSEAAKS